MEDKRKKSFKAPQLLKVRLLEFILVLWMSLLFFLHVVLVGPPQLWRLIELAGFNREFTRLQQSVGPYFTNSDFSNFILDHNDINY